MTTYQCRKCCSSSESRTGIIPLCCGKPMEYSSSDSETKVATAAWLQNLRRLESSMRLQATSQRF